jgi:2-amino-4-hydroxy-6-hydroxymethyldihydropteridine diphosphokinase
MTHAYIALGSNLDNPARQLREAVHALRALDRSVFIRVSVAYRSAAVGPGAQPDYLNAVALIDTDLPPLQLLDALQVIENRQGRLRVERWGPRTLDLDLLLYGTQNIDHERLKVPHPEMARRNFVLYPLAEIAGDNLLLPDGTVLGTLLDACDRDDLAATTIRLDDNNEGE